MSSPGEPANQRWPAARLAVAALGVVFGDIGTSPLYALRECFGEHGVDPHRRERARRAVADLLVADLVVVRQVPRASSCAPTTRARAASSRCWRCIARAESDRADAAADRGRAARPVRRGAALRRRRHHAGDLGALARSRASRWPRTRSTPSWCPITVRHPRRRSSWSSGAAPRGIGGGLRPGDARLVPRHRGARARRRSSPRRRCWRRSTRWHAVRFFRAPRVPRLLVLGAVVLVRSPAARRSTPTWATSAGSRSASPGSASCFPALLLNYFGQGALLLARHRRPRANPFYALVAAAAARTRWSSLATVATVIASQALISGAFSLTQPGGAARLLAARHHRPHLARDRGTDLHPRGQPGADGRLHRARARVPHVEQPRGGVRHRGDRHDGHHHARLLLRRHPRLALAAVEGARRCRWRLPRDRPRVLRRQPPQVRPRRLVPGGGGDRRVRAA